MKNLLTYTVFMILLNSCQTTKNAKFVSVSLSQFEGESVAYHEFYRTASDQHIARWNINRDSLPIEYIKETIDKMGRVVELKFYKNKTFKYTTLCYLSTWIKYEYPDDKTIIAYSLNEDGKEDAAIECEMASKYTYKLSDDKKTILSTHPEYNLDKDSYLKEGWNEGELNELIEALNSEQNNHLLIFYFDYSFNKMNGVFPVSKDFNDDLRY